MEDSSLLPEQPGNPDPSQIAKAFSSLGASKGGKARAKSLTKERRSQIARAAVEARWRRQGKLKPLPQAICGSPDRPLRIGTIEIPCYVLDDGRRVLSQRGLQTGIGMNVSGGAQRMLNLVQTICTSPDQINELTARIREPIKFNAPQGGTAAHGYEATILADICDAVLEARREKRLNSQQDHLATRCEILVRGFARVGIIALVDEATGYQEERARDALAKILEAFVAKELQKWVKTFPAEYYRELYRLKGLEYPPKNNRMPRYFGTYTNDIVYSRLAPGVLEELKAKNPADQKGYRRHKFTQWLSQDIGHPKLLQHLSAAIALMKVADDYEGFHKLLNRAMPKQIAMPLFDDLDRLRGEEQGAITA